MKENILGRGEQCYGQLYFVCYTLCICLFCVVSLIIIVIFISVLNIVGTEYFSSEIHTSKL